MPISRLRQLSWPKGYAAIALYLAIAAILFFWDPLFTWSPDQILSGGDIGAMFAPWLQFTFDSLRHTHELPLWNPYLFGGTPFYANPQPMLFYPFTYLGLLVPLARAMALTLALHAWLGGMGMYGWLRSLGAEHSGAALAGLAFAFSGTFAVRVGAGHYGIALQLAWWPLSFWALQSAFARRSWRWAIMSGAPLAMALLSGHTATCLLLYVALGAYTLFMCYLSRAHHKRILALAAIAVLMSLALAAVQYLPLLNLSQLSARASDPSLAFATRFSMPIGQLVALVVPNFFGEPMHTGYWGAEGYEEITYYVGLLILLVAIIGVRLRQPRVWFFLALAFGAVLLQLGADGVLFTFFYRFVPGFALTRAPGRAGLIYTFAIITAAGLVWSEIERALPDVAQRLLGTFNKTIVEAISILTGAAILAAYLFYATFKESTGTAWPWRLAGQLTLFLVLFWASMALLAAWKNRVLSQRAVSVLAAMILLFDLWSFGAKNIQPRENTLAGWSSVAEFMQKQPDYRVAAEEMNIFQLNGALAYRLRSHYGYDPLVLARYQSLIGSAPDYFDRVYDLLNIKFVITRNPISFQANQPQFTLVLDAPETKIYQRSSALPRAYIAHTVHVKADDAQAMAMLRAPDFPLGQTVILPATPPCTLAPVSPTEVESAQIVNESPNHLELSTQSSAAGLLVLSEVYYPGWEARVDGQPAQVLRADTTLRAICLPAGTHNVQFDFRPGDLALGAIISGVGLAFLFLVALIPNHQAHRHADQADD